MGNSLVPKKLEETGTHKHRFEVNSESSDRVYVVSQRKSTGAWECGCRGWIRHRHCKHLATLQPLLEQIAAKENESQVAEPKKALKAKA
jgi:hypothetical protein